ncbi:TPM domain-containing protein, partial [Tyzzerella sp. OttesenSCG-928-J15]|nr:TPM domain-containing protein [Tyzzerella sp. OttesenSCG-928-J15]
MKKLLRSIMLVLSLLFLFSAKIMAADIELVYDGAYLLTDDEYFELNDLAEEISEEYGCDIAVVTIEDMGDDDAYNFAKWVYEEYNFGRGAQRSCLMLFLSMAERDYALIAYGYGNTAFTDHGKDVMLDRHVLPLLGEDK